MNKLLSRYKLIKNMAHWAQTSTTPERDAAMQLLKHHEHLSDEQIAELTCDELDLENNEVSIKSAKIFKKLKPKTVTAIKKYLRQRHKNTPQTATLFITQKGRKMSVQAVKKVTTWKTI